MQPAFFIPFIIYKTIIDIAVNTRQRVRGKTSV